MLDNIATTLSGLDLDDVTVATEVEFNAMRQIAPYSPLSTDLKLP